MCSWSQFIEEQSINIKNKRIRRPKISGGAKYLTTSNNSLLNFVSNDYLGLTDNTDLKKSFINAVETYGVGSGGAPSLGGYSAQADSLAKELATWLEYESCLLFNSGYQLNIGLFKPLCDSNTKIWFDKRCHASHIDGILLSKTKFTTFDNNTIQNVMNHIQQQSKLRHLIITEGTFSMDGSCTYLHELIKLKVTLKDNLLLVIDDAHGIGALGSNGFGSLEQLVGVPRIADLLIGTLGKAFATQGAFVCGKKELINYLTHTASSQIYSTMLPPAIYAASRQSLHLISSDQGRELRKKLIYNINYWKNLVKEYNLNVYNHKNNHSPIQLVIQKTTYALENLHQQLLQKEILTGKISYPTVPQNSPRLRISINTTHQESDLELLASSIASAMKE